MSASLIVFLGISILVAACSMAVAFSRNLLYSAFGLLGTLFGTAVLYGLLAADFVAVTQLLIYVGGILILILFAVMLTADIASLKVTNRSVNWKLAAPIVAALFFGMVAIFGGARWNEQAAEYGSIVERLGNALLQNYLLPFEFISILLLAALLGAVVIVRREVK